MAPPQHPAWTPVQIRGKRHGAEKKGHKKRRKPAMRTRRGADDLDSSSSSKAPSIVPRKRNRTEQEEPLECLPAEVTQLIFEYSGNIALPSVSRKLASKLTNSTHLRLQITSLLVDPVLRQTPESSHASPVDLARATRLLNARFVTWGFFCSWLQGVPEVSRLVLNTSKNQPANIDWSEAWSSLRPASNLLPPKKLLSPPFTQDKTSFLAVLAPNVQDIATIDPAYGEVAAKGLVTAVRQGNSRTVSLLLGMGLESSTELLRSSVVDAGCDEDLVRMLLSGQPDLGGHGTAGRTIDLLDPVLWSWAEKAKKRGDGKGEWLMALLRDAQQHKGCPVA